MRGRCGRGGGGRCGCEVGEGGGTREGSVLRLLKELLQTSDSASPGPRGGGGLREVVRGV